MYLESGVVHQDVQSIELSERFVNGFAAKDGVTDITFQDDASTAFVFDCFASYLCVVILRQVTNGDVRPFAREKDGYRTANT